MKNIILQKVKNQTEKAQLIAGWKKLIKKHKISIRDLHNEFSEKYPDTMTYDGFYTALKMGLFKHENFEKAKVFFAGIQKAILKANVKSKKSAA